MRRLTLPLLSLLGLIGCAGDARFPEPAQGEPRLARDLLERSAARGPVTAELRGLPDGVTAEAVRAAAAAGVRGRAVTFAEAVTPDGYRLVLAFAGRVEAEDAVCRSRGEPPAPTSDPKADGRQLSAAWCSGPVAIAAVTGEAPSASPAALERTVWQATSRLFPDPYPDQYGADLFGHRVRLGATVTP